LNNGNYTNKQKHAIDITIFSTFIQSNQLTWNTKPYWNPQHQYSDHLPILITYHTFKPPPPIFTTWNLNSVRWDLFTHHCNLQFEHNYQYWLSSNNIESLNDYITNTIKSIATDTIGIKTSQKNPFPWITKKVIYYQKLAKKYDRKYYKTQKPFLHHLKNKYTHLTRHTIKENKTKWEKRINSILSDGNLKSKQFWKILNRLDLKPSQNIQPFVINDKEINDNAVKAQYLIKNVISPPKPQLTNISKQYYQQHLKNYYKNIYYQLPTNNPFSHILNDPIEYYELNEIIKNIPSENAMGIDYIHKNFLKI